MCHARRVRRIAVAEEQQEDSEQEYLVEAIMRQIKREETPGINAICEWSTEVEINGQPVQCKIDTGAEVNVLNKQTAEKVGAVVEKSDMKLKNYNHSAIDVYGMTSLTCKANSKFAQVDFHAGLPFIQKFGLLQRVDVIHNNNLNKLPEKIFFS